MYCFQPSWDSKTKKLLGFADWPALQWGRLQAFVAKTDKMYVFANLIHFKDAIWKRPKSTLF